MSASNSAADIPSQEVVLPTPGELRSLLDAQRPATVLRLLPEKPPSQLVCYQAEALLELDRLKDAHDVLDPVVSSLGGNDFAEAERVWANVLLHVGLLDSAILAAQNAAEAAQHEELSALALAVAALGYAGKRCWNLAENMLRQAVDLAPNHPRVLAAQGRLCLDADQRIQARQIYERMAGLDATWASLHANWGRSYVAYLLGEFDQAQQFAEQALSFSEEAITPLFVLAQVALARNDVEGLARALECLHNRSPQAESLEDLQKELNRLQARVKNASLDARSPLRRRLSAFPTLIQRRDYCGPSTVELVLRYWQGGLDLTNDQIADKVKFPQSGTPVYRIREFFHLVGFDTIRTNVPILQLKNCIAAGYPAIIQEEYSNSSHVAVIIGYDDGEHTIELQDPMTHVVTVLSYDELDHLRRNFYDSAIIAFPRGQGREQELARLGLFDHPVIVWTDQAVLELDQGRPESAASLMERAVRRLPAHILSWMMLLHARLEIWRLAQQQSQAANSSRIRRDKRENNLDPQAARNQFYKALENAKRHHPKAEFVYYFEGNGALLDTDLPRALVAFQRSGELDPQDARNYALLAECQYALRQMEAASEAAWKALTYDPGLPAANAWMGRCMAEVNHRNTAHYTRVVAELAPNWWLSYQLQAETYLQQEDFANARRYADLALSSSPEKLEARVLRDILMAFTGEGQSAAEDLEQVLEQNLRPITRYKACQTLARLYLGAAEYERARRQVALIQEIFPQDPWVLQFDAAVYCAALRKTPGSLDEETLSRVHELYRKGVQANQGESWVVRDYLSCVNDLQSPQAGAQAAQRLIQEYPDNHNLYYWLGFCLGACGDHAAAAQAMLTALSHADGIRDREEMMRAVMQIVRGLGAEQSLDALRRISVPEGGAPQSERERALGLALAQGSEDQPRANKLASELLRTALAEDPEDAAVTLRLGNVISSEQDREILYRQSLMLAPDWHLARANLAAYLVDQRRPDEALEFTTGYERENLDILAAHARALLGMGHYEEAVDAFSQLVEEAEEPESWLYFDLWVAELESGSRGEALKTARKGIKLFDDPRWYLHLATSLRSLDRLAEAQRAIKKGKTLGLSDIDVLKAEYEVAMASQDYKVALDITSRLLELDDVEAGDGRLDWAEAAHLRLLVELGRLDDALNFLASEELAAEGWGEAAWMIMLTDAHALTLELADRSLRLDSQNYEALYARAGALSSLDREDDALAALQQLQESYPAEHNAYEKLALRLAADERLDEALELAERSVSLGPFCPFAWATRGLVNFLRAQNEDAEADLQTAWNRADNQRRRRSNEFWWLLALLREETSAAEQHRRLAYEEAKTGLSQRILALIEATLARPEQG